MMNLQLHCHWRNFSRKVEKQSILALVAGGWAVTQPGQFTHTLVVDTGRLLTPGSQSPGSHWLPPNRRQLQLSGQWAPEEEVKSNSVSGNIQKIWAKIQQKECHQLSMEVIWIEIS